MQLQDRTTYTPAEYLALEETADFRGQRRNRQSLALVMGACRRRWPVY
jgi:hypothetical protein